MATPARTYVLDTSVLLSDPKALLKFAEHQVILPVVVITELEKKRHDPELGYFARKALHLLDDLRIANGRLDQPVPVGSQGGTVRVELNSIDDSVLPSGMRLGDNDTKILAVAANLAKTGADVTVVSKDLPMRVKASSIGLDADVYRNPLSRAEPRGELKIIPVWMGWSSSARISGSSKSMLLSSSFTRLAGSPLVAKSSGSSPGSFVSTIVSNSTAPSW